MKSTRFYYSLILFIFPVFLLGMTPTTLKKIDTLFSNANSIEDFKASEALILNSMKSFPKQTELTWRLARNYFGLAKKTANENHKMNLFQQCLKTAKEGISIDEVSAENIYYMGVCLGNISLQKGILSSLRNREVLKTSMERAVAIDPNVEHAGPHRFLGVYYGVLPFFLGGDSEKAIHHLETAVNLTPNYYENYFFLGKVYFDNGYYPKAKKSLENFLKLKSTAKNAPDLPKQIVEARELLERIKSDQNNE